MLRRSSIIIACVLLSGAFLAILVPAVLHYRAANRAAREFSFAIEEAARLLAGPGIGEASLLNRSQEIWWQRTELRDCNAAIGTILELPWDAFAVSTGAARGELRSTIEDTFAQYEPNESARWIDALTAKVHDPAHAAAWMVRIPKSMVWALLSSPSDEHIVAGSRLAGALVRAADGTGGYWDMAWEDEFLGVARLALRRRLGLMWLSRRSEHGAAASERDYVGGVLLDLNRARTSEALLAKIAGIRAALSLNAMYSEGSLLRTVDVELSYVGFMLSGVLISAM